MVNNTPCSSICIKERVPLLSWKLFRITVKSYWGGTRLERFSLFIWVSTTCRGWTGHVVNSSTPGADSGVRASCVSYGSISDVTPALSKEVAEAELLCLFLTRGVADIWVKDSVTHYSILLVRTNFRPRKGKSNTACSFFTHCVLCATQRCGLLSKKDFYSFEPEFKIIPCTVIEQCTKKKKKSFKIQFLMLLFR